MTKPMHILLAPDSFKGSLSSSQIIEALAQAAHDLMPDAVLTPVPIADGGEGTVEAMAAAALESVGHRVGHVLLRRGGLAVIGCGHADD